MSKFTKKSYCLSPILFQKANNITAEILDKI